MTIMRRDIVLVFTCTICLTSMAFFSGNHAPIGAPYSCMSHEKRVDHNKIESNFGHSISQQKNADARLFAYEVSHG